MAFKILAVENELDTLKLIKEMAEALGNEVVAFNSGLEAAHQVYRQKFNGALISASTPYMDGLELVHLLRSSLSNRHVPIVMLTEFDDAKTMRAAFEAGVTFFLSKPLYPKKVESLLVAMRDQMLKDKRRYVRLPLRTIVQCRVEEYESKSLSVNVSQTGMLLEPSAGLSLHQKAELLFELPNIARQLNPRATVVRKESDNCLGVRFARLSTQDHKALSDFISGTVEGQRQPWWQK